MLNAKDDLTYLMIAFLQRIPLSFLFLQFTILLFLRVNQLFIQKLQFSFPCFQELCIFMQVILRLLEFIATIAQNMSSINVRYITGRMYTSV